MFVPSEISEMTPIDNVVTTKRDKSDILFLNLIEEPVRI
jgi:hypothetical protein